MPILGNEQELLPSQAAVSLDYGVKSHPNSFLLISYIQGPVIPLHSCVMGVQSYIQGLNNCYPRSSEGRKTLFVNALIIHLGA